MRAGHGRPGPARPGRAPGPAAPGSAAVASPASRIWIARGSCHHRCQVSAVRASDEGGHRQHEGAEIVARARGCRHQLAMPRLAALAQEGPDQRRHDHQDVMSPAPRALRGEKGRHRDPVPQRAEAAPPIGVVHGGDGRLHEGQAQGGGAQQHLGLEDEPAPPPARGREQRQRVDAKAGLRVAQRRSRSASR